MEGVGRVSEVSSMREEKSEEGKKYCLHSSFVKLLIPKWQSSYQCDCKEVCVK